MNNLKRKIRNLLLIGGATLSIATFGLGVNILPNLEGDKNQPKVDQMSVKVSSEKLKSISEKYKDVKKLDGIKLDSRNQKVADIISNSKMNISEKEKTLNNLDVYFCNTDDNSAKLSSSQGDVELNTPTITYHAYTNRTDYAFYGSGKWKNHNYDVEGFSWWYPSVGDKINIGGDDALGISFYQPKGDASRAQATWGWSGFTNGDIKDYSNTLSTAEDQYGGVYRLQDYIKITDVTNYVVYVDVKYKYNAFNLSTYLMFKGLENYDGFAKTFYSHTWDNTQITSIGLGADSVSVDFNTTSSHWNGYSHSLAF